MQFAIGNDSFASYGTNPSDVIGKTASTNKKGLPAIYPIGIIMRLSKDRSIRPGLNPGGNGEVFRAHIEPISDRNLQIGRAIKRQSLRWYIGFNLLK